MENDSATNYWELAEANVSTTPTMSTDQVYYDEQTGLSFCWDDDNAQWRYCNLNSDYSFHSWLESADYKDTVEESGVGGEVSAAEQECESQVSQAMETIEDKLNESITDRIDALSEKDIALSTTSAEDSAVLASSESATEGQELMEMRQSNNDTSFQSVSAYPNEEWHNLCIEQYSSSPNERESDNEKNKLALVPESMMSGLLNSTLSVENDTTTTVDSLLKNVKSINENLWSAEIPDKIEYLEAESQSLKAKFDKAYTRSQQLIVANREQLLQIETMEDSLSKSLCVIAEAQLLGIEATHSSLKREVSDFVATYQHLASKS